MRTKSIMSVVAVGAACGIASATVSDIGSFIDAARLFNDRPGSNLTFMSNFDPAVGSVHIAENNYGAGGFANRHAAWFGDDPAANKVDFDFGDGWDMSMTMQIKDASNVDNVEAGFQFDLFGFGLFGGLTANGEIAAFGSVMPFFSFGTGLFAVGDEVQLRMVHRPGDAQFGSIPSTMEYMYNNVTQGSGWVSSGEVAFTTTEGGIPSAFDMYVGVGAQINNPDPTLGSIEINFTQISIPSPSGVALLGLGGLASARRRR